jgi:hypothetical protein
MFCGGANKGANITQSKIIKRAILINSTVNNLTLPAHKHVLVETMHTVKREPRFFSLFMFLVRNKYLALVIWYNQHFTFFNLFLTQNILETVFNSNFLQIYCLDNK